jgi:hypothetical protein
MATRQNSSCWKWGVGVEMGKTVAPQRLKTWEGICVFFIDFDKRSLFSIRIHDSRIIFVALKYQDMHVG